MFCWKAFYFIFYHGPRFAYPNMSLCLLTMHHLSGGSPSSCWVRWGGVCACPVAQMCPTLCNPMDCSPWIPQARILEWVAIPFSRRSSWPRDWTRVTCIGRWVPHHWTTWEAQNVTWGVVNGAGMKGACLWHCHRHPSPDATVTHLPRSQTLFIIHSVKTEGSYAGGGAGQ